MKNSNILALRFDHFPVSLYIAHILKKLKNDRRPLVRVMCGHLVQLKIKM